MDAPGPPRTTPIGLRLTRTARVVSQAFDRAMAEAGGSGPVWQVLLLIRSRQWEQQSEMARAMGVTSNPREVLAEADEIDVPFAVERDARAVDPQPVAAERRREDGQRPPQGAASRRPVRFGPQERGECLS